MLTIGQMIGIKEYQTASMYSYMIDDAIGMSKPYPASERLKSSQGKVLEVKKTDRFNIAVLGFDE